MSSDTIEVEMMNYPIVNLSSNGLPIFCSEQIELIATYEGEDNIFTIGIKTLQYWIWIVVHQIIMQQLPIYLLKLLMKMDARHSVIVY